MQADLQAKGLAFNKTDPDSFRAKLRDAGFYSEWKEPLRRRGLGPARGRGRQARLSAAPTGRRATPHGRSCRGTLGAGLQCRRAASLACGDGSTAALGAAVEAVAAVLVLVEIVMLGAGVIARYVFHAPLVWSDELASILFLWLSMLGAVVALRRGEHMRMTGLVSRVSAADARAARSAGDHGRDRLPAADPAACAANMREEETLHRHAGAGDQQRLARRGDPGRRRR